MSISRLSSVFNIARVAGKATPFAALCVAARCYATKFTKDHEWVTVEGETATIGITDYAQHTLGDLVYVELPSVGSTVTQNAEMGIVESVKAASDVLAPVTGEVTEINDKVVESPALINSSAATDGWLIKVKLTKPLELNDLLDETAYESLCKAAKDDE